MDSPAAEFKRYPATDIAGGEMLAVRPRREGIGVALAVGVSTLAIAAATGAWIAAPLSGFLFILRFTLQPPEDHVLTWQRRSVLALLGCSALACVAWALGVRIAHWPG